LTKKLECGRVSKFASDASGSEESAKKAEKQLKKALDKQSGIC
jgi:hypothetical protein